MKSMLLPLVAALSLSGCATIFEGGTQPVTIKSVPEAVSISVTNRSGEKVHAGTTPVTVTLKRGAGYFKPETYRVHMEKQGFAPKDLTISGSINGWYFGNILLGGLIGMLIVDPITGAMYNLAPDVVTSTLDAMDVKTSKDERSLTVVLAENLPTEAWKHAQPILTGK